jgi:hypothetical protein
VQVVAVCEASEKCDAGHRRKGVCV